MPIKALSTGVAALAIVGAAAACVTSIAPVGPTATFEIQSVVFGVPQPLDPAEDLPSPDDLMGVLNGLQDPGVPFASKGNLIEGGIGGLEGRVADSKLQKAAAKGQLPLSFDITNIRAAGPDAATADVTATSPAVAPITQNVKFVNQGNWMISRSSAITLLQRASAGR